LVGVEASASEKGWARNSIIAFLAQGSASLSEIAARTGVSKSTASYHMRELVERGIAEIIDVKRVKGGVYTKTFAIRRGTVVVALPRATEGDVDRSVQEQYTNLKISWSPDSRSEDIILFLYHVFLSLPGASRDELEEIFLAYGRLFGQEVIAKSLRAEGLNSEMREVTRWLTRTGSAVCTLENAGDGTNVLTCTTFFRATDSRNPVFGFLRGIVDGVLAAKHGERYFTEARQGESESPRIAIVRRKGLETRGA